MASWDGLLHGLTPNQGFKRGASTPSVLMFFFGYESVGFLFLSFCDSLFFSFMFFFCVSCFLLSSD